MEMFSKSVKKGVAVFALAAVTISLISIFCAKLALYRSGKSASKNGCVASRR